MGWLICFAAMAFFGAVCIMWTLLGWFFPTEGQAWIFCEGNPGVQENGLIRRYFLLRDLGLIRWSMIVVDLGISAPERRWLLGHNGIVLWTKEEYRLYLETERRRIDGAGNGDYPGRDQRRGL